MNIRSRVLPSGGSAILAAWRQMHGPEALRQQALGVRGAQWLPGGPSAHLLTGGAVGRGLRAYMAASNDRLVADMASLLGDVSANGELRMSLRAMRRRSRQLANDNEYVKRFLQLVRNNVVGPRGFALQSKVYKVRKKDGVPDLDENANVIIEQAYAEHSKASAFSASGKLSRAAFERAAITCMARDGEVIVEELIGRQFGRFGIAWRLLDPDLLDERLNALPGHAVPGYGALESGHDITMGVERNAYGRPVAYWFLTVHPGDGANAVRTHRRVLAERILHHYLAEEQRPDAARGVPWIYSAIRRMAMLGGYEEAALVNARQGASKMGFYKRPAAEPSPINPAGAASGDEVADGEDGEGNLIQEAEPGVFGVLPAGWDFQTYDPAYPNDAMEGFVKSMLRAFASGVGPNYNTIAQDYEGVSLSALRHAANQDRDFYETLQQHYVDGLGLPMFERWLKLSLGLGQVGPLPADGFERFNAPRLIARPFRSPDPQKDVAADAQAVALGTTSRTRVCARNGDDFDEVLDELAAEEAKARAKGVTLNTAAAGAHKTPAVDDAGKPAKPGAEAGTQPQPEDDDEPEGAAA